MSAPRAAGRLVVALPPDEASLALLDAALALADRLQRELLGLFLEDEGLLAAAGLPFTRIVPRRALAEVAFDVASTERAVRVLAERARHRLAAAGTRSVRWRLEVLRGGLEAAGLEAGDVLALGVTGALLAGTPSGPLPCPVVVIGRRGGPVLLVHEGSEEVLRLAEALARDGGLPLVVLVAGPEEAEAARRRFGEGVRVLSGELRDEAGLVALLRAQRPGLVVLDGYRSDTIWKAAVEAVRPGGEAGTGHGHEPSR